MQEWSTNGKQIDVRDRTTEVSGDGLADIGAVVLESLGLAFGDLDRILGALHVVRAGQYIDQRLRNW